MSSTGIPLDANFKNLSCQAGGLTLNGNVSQGTAISLNVLTVNDPTVAQTLTKTITSLISFSFSFKNTIFIYRKRLIIIKLYLKCNYIYEFKLNHRKVRIL